MKPRTNLSSSMSATLRNPTSVKPADASTDTTTVDDERGDEIDESRLAIDVSVYGGASEISCEIWPEESEVGSAVVLGYFNRLQRMRAVKYAGKIPGIAPAAVQG